MKTSDQVFAAAKIDACFAAGCRIYLGQERRRNLQDGNAAHEDSREEAAHIRYDPTAETNYNTGPVSAPLRHLFREPLEVGQPLVTFATFEPKNFVLARFELTADDLSV